jgi:hypothetical protein
MRVSFFQRSVPYILRAILFVIIFAAVGEVFVRLNARDVVQTRQYVESGSPLVIVVDDPVVLDMVNHIVQGRARVVMVRSVSQANEGALRLQMGSELVRARYVFFAMNKQNTSPSGSVISLDDLTFPTAASIVQPVYVTSTSAASSSTVAPSSMATSPRVLVYGATTTAELTAISRRYFWIAPSNAEMIASAIARALGTNDLVNKTFFINNAYDYSSQISSLRINSYVAGQMKNVPAVVVDGRYVDFPLDFGFAPRAVVDGVSFDTDHESELFALVARALVDTKAKVLFVPDEFPAVDFKKYARSHHLTAAVVALSYQIERSDEGYLDLLQYNILRLQNAVL